MKSDQSDGEIIAGIVSKVGASYRAAVGGVDWLGLALDLEARAKFVESQTTERAMLAAAHGLRLMGTGSIARGMEARSGETEGLDPAGATARSPQGDAPNPDPRGETNV